MSLFVSGDTRQLVVLQESTDQQMEVTDEEHTCEK